MPILSVKFNCIPILGRWGRKVLFNYPLHRAVTHFWNIFHSKFQESSVMQGKKDSLEDMININSEKINDLLSQL